MPTFKAIVHELGSREQSAVNLLLSTVYFNAYINIKILSLLKITGKVIRN
jgi:hypothetical protein